MRKGREEKENHARIVQGVLKPKKEDNTCESRIAHIMKEMDKPVFVTHYYATVADLPFQVTQPIKMVFVADGIEHSMHSSKATQMPEKSRRDAAAQATQSECIEQSIQLMPELETAQHHLREAEKLQQIQGQNYGAYQTI